MNKSSIIKLIKRSAPCWLVLLIDCYISVNAFVLAYLIRFNFTLNFDRSVLFLQLVVVLLISSIAFISVGSYKGTIRHTQIRDAFTVVLATVAVFLLLFIVVIVNRGISIVDGFTIPLSILMIHFLINSISLIASRFLYKWLFNVITLSNKFESRVLIYGAGEAGLVTYSVLQNDRENKAHVVGFIDDDSRKTGKEINGLSVFQSVKLDNEFIGNKRIDEIIISIHNITSTQLFRIADKLSVLPINVKIVPPFKTWIDGDLNAKQIKNVHIEDLLGRKPIKLENPILEREFYSKSVLVTGAGGSIGCEISKQLANYNCEHLILVDQAESDLYNLQQYFLNKGIEKITAIVADIRDKNRMNSIFKEYLPNMLFHAAAYKHVPFMEENPYEAVNVNVGGTRRIAKLAVKYKVEKFVMISTDKAVNPTNVMGATKRIAEMYITCLNGTSKTKFITTRFGNVLGSNGSVIPLFKTQIEEGGPLKVTHREINRFFMTIPEACQLVLEAGTMGKGGEIFVFDMGESVKIYDLARNMIRLSGLRFPEDIDIEITGLRPGEKIYEELLADGETTTRTYHNKIMIANVRELEVDVVKGKINELCSINKELDFRRTVCRMKEIVPEFMSENSKYEIFDNSKTSSDARELVQMDTSKLVS